jgi:hypothetical protein
VLVEAEFAALRALVGDLNLREDLVHYRERGDVSRTSRAQ